MRVCVFFGGVGVQVELVLLCGCDQLLVLGHSLVSCFQFFVKINIILSTRPGCSLLIFSVLCRSLCIYVMVGMVEQDL